MSLDFENCPYCGQKLLHGAMRCTGCGKILKTSEEQAESIKKLKGTKKKFNTGKFLKYIIFLLILGVTYYFFSDQIIEFIRNILSRFGL